MLHAQGNLSGAVDEFLTALTLNPRLAEARSNLGFAFLDRGDPEAAANQWQAAVRLEPQLAGAWAGLALSLFRLGQEDQAVRSYRTALRLDRRYADVNFLRTVLRWSPGAIGQAETILWLIEGVQQAPPRKVMI